MAVDRNAAAGSTGAVNTILAEGVDRTPRTGTKASGAVNSTVANGVDRESGLSGVSSGALNTPLSGRGAFLPAGTSLVAPVRTSRGAATLITDASVGSCGETYDGADEHWDDVVLLCHCDGEVYGGTTLADEKGHAITVGLGAIIDTLDAKFGCSSIFCDTNIEPAMTIPAHADFLFDADFTIEFWFAFGGVVEPIGDLVQSWTTTGNGPGDRNFSLFFSVSNGKIGFSWRGTQIVTDFLHHMVTGYGYHIAVSRSGQNFYVFVDGVLRGSGTSVDNMTTAREIQVLSTSNGSMYKFLDEIRITNGVARYLTDFTPPGAFPNQ